MDSPMECAACQYEVSQEMIDTGQNCPECGSSLSGAYRPKWWGVEAAGTISRRARKQIAKGGNVTILPAVGFYILTSLGSGGTLSRHVMQFYPAPLLDWYADSGRGTAQEVAVELILFGSRSNVSQRDAFLGRITEKRDTENSIEWGIGRNIDRALENGLFSAGAIAEYHDRALDWDMVVELSADGFIQPEIDLVHQELPGLQLVHVVLVGVRIGGGDWWWNPAPPSVDVAEFAWSYTDYRRSYPGGPPSTVRRSPDSSYAGLGRFDVSGLEPGEHRMTVRLHAYVLDGIGAISHNFAIAGGDVASHPNAVWSETFDLTDTFVIPSRGGR